jgi:hypothetical protein
MSLLTIKHTNFPESSYISPQSCLQKDKSFDFSSEMKRIIDRSPAKSKSQKLAHQFLQYVNPDDIPDGHCASCAFNTHLHFLGYTINKALAPDSGYKRFGDWFYYKFAPRFGDHTLEPVANETLGSLKKRVENKITELTTPSEAVLISISEGAHWYNAYNDGERIWFIDSQTGRSFNLYEKEDRKTAVIEFPAVISIIKVTSEDISEYKEKFY